MRILIVTAIPFWHPGTKELMEELQKKGVYIEALDIFHGFFVGNNMELEKIVPFSGIFKRVYLRLFRKRLMRRYAKNYDVIDIHFVEPFYSKYLLDLKGKLICTLFGSDLFRTTKVQKEMQRPLFERADGIVLSKNMVPYFEEHFQGHQEKYLYNQYGSKRLDLLTEHKGRERNEKVYITCGYNNKKEQQHIKIIDAVLDLNEENRMNIHLLLPMTYGEDDDNVNAVKEKLNDTSLNFTIFENRLSDSEMVELHVMSDITINTQTTDALASSVKEAMAAGNIMLIGDWLPYTIYSDLGVYFRKVNFANLANEIALTIDNLEEERDKSKKNKKLIMKFASWSVLIDGWISGYKWVVDGGK